MTDEGTQSLEGWIGTSQTCDDPLAPFPAVALAALLGQEDVALDALPLL